MFRDLKVCLIFLAFVSIGTNAWGQNLCSLSMGVEYKQPELESDILGLVESFAQDRKNFHEVFYAREMIHKLPKERQKLWYEYLTHLYKTTPKKSAVPAFTWSIPQRRLLEKLIYETFRPDLKITEAIDNGQAPLEAFRDYINSQTSVYERGYDFEHVWSLVTELRQKIQNSASDPDTARIIIGGSYPNGKADLQKSDVDLSSGGSHLNPKEVQQEWLPELQQRLNSRIETSELELHISTELPPFYATYNPVVLLVSGSSVKMQVFIPGHMATSGEAMDVPAGQHREFTLD
jgi:hypothetical protein